MKKIGTTASGSIIVEMSPGEWTRAEEWQRFESTKYGRELSAIHEEWDRTPACHLLGLEEKVGFASFGPLFRLFVDKQFDGSIAQLEMIARGEPPFRYVDGIGVITQSRILKLLKQQK